jgi:hypothetical protein
MKRVAAECCQLHSRTFAAVRWTLRLHCRPTITLLVDVCILGCSAAAVRQLHFNVEWRSYIRRSGRDPAERCHSVPYCLDTRLRPPDENLISRRVSNWVSSKLPFRTFRPVSAYSVLGFQVFVWQYYCVMLCYCILCDSTVCYAGSYVKTISCYMFVE